MEQLRLPAALRAQGKELRASGRSIGLVPTMGFLHAGHLSLMKQLRPLVDHLVVSIFVNPAQFGAGEDLSRYPRSLEQDLQACEDQGVDVVFTPDNDTIYPSSYQTWITPGPVASRYCGASRSGHFRGVLSIVYRLFRWSCCNRAIFGAKDAQQLWLIRQMVRDLDLDLHVDEGAIVRESDGLAMSSRNVYLDEDQRKAAPVLNRALQLGAECLAKGGTSRDALQHAVKALSREPLFSLEYLHVADWKTLDSLAGAPEQPAWSGDAVDKTVEEHILLVAARMGGTRLIDNLRIKGKDTL